jgi:uncharacterized protein YicC (UPF0701 family)
MLASMAAKRGPKAPMSDSHKAALAQGRAEGRAVRDYLEALRSIKPKRGRSRTPDSIKKRLSAIEDQLATSDALTELKLVQERRDLTAELASMQAKVDVTSLEAAFVKVAKRYSQRQGISYASWRDVGVEPAVLKKAGITRAG